MTVPESTRRITKEVMLTEPHYQWNIGKAADVEYFPSEFDKLVLDSVANPNFMQSLEWMTKGCEGRIAIDLEWRPSFGKKENPVSIIQMATKNGIVVLRHPPELPGNEDLKKFLMSHKFIAKGCKTDTKKLNQKFGNDFKIDMKDVEKLYLTCNGFSCNFDSMVVEFYKPSSIEFKDKNVTCSNWEADVLTQQQVLYAGFDAIALYKSYQNAKKRYPNAEEDYTKRMADKAKNQRQSSMSRKNKKTNSEGFDKFKNYLVDMMPLNSGKAFWLAKNFWPLLTPEEQKDPEHILENPLGFGTTEMRGPIFQYLCGVKGVDMSKSTFKEKLTFWDKEATPRERYMSKLLDTYRVLGVAPFDAIQGVNQMLEITLENGGTLPFDII